jgi:hypothetical protein
MRLWWRGYGMCFEASPPPGFRVRSNIADAAGLIKGVVVRFEIEAAREIQRAVVGGDELQLLSHC